ncbi:hypothetical protein RRG08_013837 [Elysia crispata]|uniref:Receptor for retinol uptake STRA6 n=1 Tax=Elysia crispata TaxID=231223 RepID=A0AAE0YY25_9GAST|nr:hypothetical protein RRG08_013837 [Elysia crispata]
MRSFLSILRSILDAVMDGNGTITTCDDSVISHYTFYQYSLIPAVVLTLLFACTKTRQQRLTDFLGGRPGLVAPMNTLTRQSRISYCCAFGATAFLVYQILLEQKFAIDYQGPLCFLTLIAILTMFVYGIVYFPVFACLAMKSAFSFGLGSLYVWMFLAVDVYEILDCDLTEKGRKVMLARSLPSVGCLAYLGVSLPIRFVVSCYKKQYFTGPEERTWESLDDIKESYQGLHVRKLFRPPQLNWETNNDISRTKRIIMRYLDKWIYHVEPGFRYPSLLVSVLFVAACVVYMITVDLMFSSVDIFDVLIATQDRRLDIIGWHKQLAEDPLVTEERNQIFSHKHDIFVVETSLVLSIVLSYLLTSLNILHMLASFRSNLFAMYKGDFRTIPPPSSKNAVWLCTGCIKYTGFQVGFIVWGYIYMSVLLFGLVFFLALMFDGKLMELVEEIRNICETWPGVVVAIVLFIIQGLLAKFVFLQRWGRFLRLDNRNSYFIFAYTSCFFTTSSWAIVIGSSFLARLDSSTLPRKFECWDSGLSAYTGYVHMEAAHTHPVVNVFIRLLVSLKQRRENNSSNPATEINMVLNFDSNDLEGDMRYSRLNSVNVNAKFKWFLVYTLLQNPQIRMYRKGYIQSLKKARKRGLRVPPSDSPISLIDIDQLERQREESIRASLAPSTRHTAFSVPGSSSFRAPPSLVASEEASDIGVSAEFPQLSSFEGQARSGDRELLVPV